MKNGVEKYEYSSSVELANVTGKYFVVPKSIILAKNTNDKRLSAFSYFVMRAGMDNRVYFSVNEIIRWLGRKQDRHSTGINNRILQMTNYFKNEGYLNFDGELTSSSAKIEAEVNNSAILQICKQENFAIIYVDEYMRIAEYQKLDVDTKDSYLNKDIILLVFAYLRMKIYRRKNRLAIDEININNKNSLDYDIHSRRKANPEAYNCYYIDIAEELGISERMVSKAANVLKEIGLIYLETLPRIKYNDNWVTEHTIFCNTYKREGNLLLDSGEEYYMREIKNKKDKLKKYKYLQNKNNQKE
jgi:hypothetical protein